MNIAVNREEINKHIFMGLGEVMRSTLGSWAIGYSPQSTYEYNPEKAKKLLSEAGYSKGFTIKLYSYPRAGFPEGADMLLAVAGYWSAIGIDVEIVPTEYGTVRAMWPKKKKLSKRPVLVEYR